MFFFFVSVLLTPQSENTGVMTWSLKLRPFCSVFIMSFVFIIMAIHQRFWVSCRAPPAARMSGAPRGKCDTPRALGLTTGSRCSVTSVFIAPFPAAPSKLLAWNANNLTRGSRSPYLRRRVYPAEVQLHCMSRRAGRSTGLLDYFHLSFTLCELEPLGLRAVHLELFC